MYPSVDAHQPFRAIRYELKCVVANFNLVARWLMLARSKIKGLRLGLGEGLANMLRSFKVDKYE